MYSVIKSIINDYIYRARPFRMLPLRIFHKLGILRYINLTVPIRYNQKRLWIPLLSSRGVPLLRMEMHEQWLEKIFSNLEIDDGGYFVDVGVNLGQTLIKSRLQFPQLAYIGFEPNPNCVSYVDKLIMVNSFENSTVLTCALSDKTCSATFLNKTLLGTQGTIPEISGIKATDFRIESTVLCVDGKDIFNTDELRPLRLIKIDVEGGELNVITAIKDVLKKDKPVIILEILSGSVNFVNRKKNLKEIELFSLLKKMGYFIARISVDGSLVRDWDAVSYDKGIKLTNDYMCWCSSHESSIAKLSFIN